MISIIPFFSDIFEGDRIMPQEKIIRRGGLYRDGLNGIGDWVYFLVYRTLPAGDGLKQVLSWRQSAFASARPTAPRRTAS
jgi:hypothetical protein